MNLTVSEIGKRKKILGFQIIKKIFIKEIIKKEK